MSSERIFINNTPPLPGKCSACNNDFKPGKVAIDFNVSVDYYGAILLCEYCIVNAAELVGMVPVAKFNEAKSDNRILAAELFSTRAKVQILESFVASYFSDPDFSLDALLASSPDLSLLEQLAERELASGREVTGEPAELTESATG